MNRGIKQKHFKFQDRTHGEVAFIQEGEWTGWLFKWSESGNWISLRMVNADDMAKIEKTMAVMN